MNQINIQHFLYPSTIYVSNQEAEVMTILGSCIAVCLWDQVLKIGGVNHYMLPLWNGQGLASPKYGNIAIQKLVEKMQDHGSLINNIQAKVFGGASNLYGESYYQIGERNIQIARKSLSDLKIKLIAESVGGNRGRKIIFNTNNGQVLMYYVASRKT